MKIRDRRTGRLDHEIAPLDVGAIAAVSVAARLPSALGGARRGGRGVLLRGAISPWNFPLIEAIPALLAGGRVEMLGGPVSAADGADRRHTPTWR